MARVDYSNSPEVAADTSAPNDEQHIAASPNAFGAQVGQAVNELGQGAVEAADFYGKVASDEATTNYLEGRQKVLYGDLSQPAVDASGNSILGPDGSPVGQGGFYSLRGADAINAAPNVQAQLQKLSDQQLETLTLPESRHAFTMQTRRYEAQELEKMGTFTDQQYRVWGAVTNNKGIAVTRNGIGTHLNDPTALAADREDLRKFYVRNSILQFGHDPAAADAAVIQADQDWAMTQITASLPRNAANARTVLDANRNILASLPDYDKISAAVDGAVFNQVSGPAADADANAALVQAKSSVAQAGAGAAPGAGDVTSRILAVEGTRRNPASSAVGPGQFLNGTFRQYIGQVSPQVAQQIAGMSDSQLTVYRAANAGMLAPLQTQMTGILTHANQQSLQRAGIPVTDGNTYMAHVFGVGGAEAAIHAGPNAPAAQYVGGADRLTKNGIPANATVGQVQAWADHKMGSATGTSAYPSVTDALQANMSNYLDAARTHAEQLFPGQNDQQERYVEDVRRKIENLTSQQAAQYRVDAHTVQEYISSNNVISDQQMEIAPPNIVAAWHSMKDNNPAALASVEHTFSANAIGRAEGLGVGFKGYLDRVLAPSNDPGRIADPSQVWGVVGAGQDATLTNSGADQLAKLSGIRGTPKGEADAAMIRTFIDRMHDSMTYSNPATGLTDPKGEAAFNRFAATVLPELVNSQKQGTLANILNPQSKDFIGPTANAFLRTPAQIVRDRLKAEGVESEGTYDQPNSIQGLHALVKEKKISPEEAAWIANQRGIPRPAAPKAVHPPMLPGVDPLAGFAVGTEVKH